MLRTYAVCASIASMSRKSSASFVTFSLFHVAPPSVVRSTVAPEPLAHATLSLTALTPRKRAVTPLVCNVQRGIKTSPIPRPTLNNTNPCFIRVIRGLFRSFQASIQLGRRREPAITIRLPLTRRLLVTLVLGLVLTRRYHFVIRTNLTRTTSLLARLERSGRRFAGACTQIKLRHFQHLRSSCWSSHRRVLTADEYAIGRSHRLRCFTQQILRRARAA